jgi:hypothetical protein
MVEVIVGVIGLATVVVLATELKGTRCLHDILHPDHVSYSQYNFRWRCPQCKGN